MVQAVPGYPRSNIGQVTSSMHNHVTAWQPGGH